jgi:hypothetical protein
MLQHQVQHPDPRKLLSYPPNILSRGKEFLKFIILVLIVVAIEEMLHPPLIPLVPRLVT